MARLSGRLIPVALVFYGVMAGVALLSDTLAPGSSNLWPSPSSASMKVSVPAGVALAVVALIGGRILASHFRWAQRLREDLAALLGPLGRVEVVSLALMSSIAEEMLFRGVLQPTIGLWGASALFAVCHGFFERRWLPWMGTAGVVGLALGLLAIWTGSLVAPIVAHFLINLVELRELARRRRRASS